MCLLPLAVSHWPLHARQHRPYAVVGDSCRIRYPREGETNGARSDNTDCGDHVAAEGIEPGTRFAWRFTEREHVLEVRVLKSVAEVAADLRPRSAV